MGGVAMTILENVVRGLAQDQWRKVRNARLKLVLCRLMIDIMRTVHGAYTPAGEPFRARLEIFFIALCVAISDMEGKLFYVAKIASYMRVPRTTAIRRLDQLQTSNCGQRHPGRCQSTATACHHWYVHGSHWSNSYC
jgi:hypothetical protein